MRVPESSLKAPIALRFNPDVDPKTHPMYHGVEEEQFGIDLDTAVKAYEQARHLEAVEILE